MGNGVSSKEANALVHKWDRALDDLKSLTHRHRRLGSGIGVAPTASPTAAGSSSVGNRSVLLVGQDDDLDHADGGARAPLGKHGDLVIHSDVGSSVSVSHACSPTNANLKKVSKTTAAANKAIREAHYASYEMTDAQRSAVHQATTSTHFAAAAVALSQLLGGKRNAPRETVVTVEDLFFAAEIPLTYLRQRSIELEELFTIVQRFIETDSRFRSKFGAEVVHLDIAPAVGHVSRSDNRLVGEHACKVTQPKLLEALKDDLASAEAVYLVQFDPWTLLQEVQQDEDDDDEESLDQYRPVSQYPSDEPAHNTTQSEVDNATFMSSTIRQSVVELTSQSAFTTMPRVNDQNDGLVAVLTNCRPKVLDTIELAEAANFPGNILAVSRSEYPYQALYKAMLTTSRGSGRARGYIRIFKQDDEMAACASPDDDPVVPFLSHELMSGNVIGHLNGTCHASAVDPVFAPHLVAAAWGLHLLNGTIADSHRHGYGLPISDLIRTLRLPAETYLESDLPLDQVHLYIDEYLRLKQLDGQYNTDVTPVVTKGTRASAVPSLTQHELAAMLFEVADANDDDQYPAVVMLFQYDAAIAHNALGVPARPQWGVLAGYDRTRELARIIDANSAAFGRSWTVACEWLLQAITGYGYIVMRNVPRLLRRQSMRGSASLCSSLRVGTTARDAMADVDGGDAWTPTAATRANVRSPAAAQPINSRANSDVGSGGGMMSGVPSVTSGAGGDKDSATVTSNNNNNNNKEPPLLQDSPNKALHSAPSRLKRSKTEVGALRRIDSDVKRRLAVAGVNRTGLFEGEALVPTFTFPVAPLAVTCLAAGLTRVGRPTQVDDILLRATFNVNDLVTRNVGLNSFKVIADNYLEMVGDALKFEITTVHVHKPVVGDAQQMLATPFGGAASALDKKPPLESAIDLIAIAEHALSPNEAPYTALVVHFSSKEISIVGGNHPFGEYGIVTGVITLPDSNEKLFEISDMHPNGFLRRWKVQPNVLFRAMFSHHPRTHRPRGIVLLRRVDAAENEAKHQAPRQRHLTLSAAPFFNAFHTTISPQIYGLSLAFSQLGFFFSPDEIFYEAYLKTVRSGTRRNSQARAWRDVDVSFDVLNRNINARLLAELGTKFLASRRERELKVELLASVTPEQFYSLIQEASLPESPVMLVIMYDAGIIHGLPGMGTGTAILQSLDPERQVVGMFDAEHATYGLRWRVPLPSLIDACDKASGSVDGSFALVSVRRVPPPEKPDGDSDEEHVEIKGEFGAAAF